MASNSNSYSARIAFLFFLLLAFAVDLHECRRAPGKHTPVLVQNCKRPWANSDQSLNGGTAQRKPPAPTQAEESVEQGVGPERLFMVTDKSPVPPTPLNPTQPGGIMVTDKSPVPPTPLNPTQPGGIMVTDKSPVPPTPLNPTQPGGIMVTDKSPVPATTLNPSQPGNIMVTDKSPVPPTTLNPSQPGARMLSAQDKGPVPPMGLNPPSPSCC